MFRPEFFRRQDESADPLFYDMPRLVVHIDEQAVDAVTEYLGEVLPVGAVVLDLMSSWRSHLPEDHAVSTLVGLGMNAAELRENPQLDERVVHDLNADPALPWASGRFAAAVVTVSIQYMTRPVEVFREVRRVLAAGGTFHVIFSDRMFPTKAVAVWHSLPLPRRRAELIAAYFDEAGGFDAPEFVDRSPSAQSDPVYVVRASRQTSPATSAASRPA
jgi:SAM-dependent methyltransferase